MFDISDIGFCVATKTTVDICLFMTLVFVLPLKLLWLQKSIYDSGFCVATETAEVAAVYL